MKNTIYVCNVCNFAYRQEKDAKACEEWCSRYQSCNTKITARSIGLLKPKALTHKANKDGRRY